MNLSKALNRGIVVAVVALFGLSAVSSVVAQDATEVPAEMVVTHPAHVHVGTCADLDPNPAYPLNNVGPRTDDDGNAPEPDEVKGSLSANAVEISSTEIEVNLDDLLTEAHGINVHESDSNMGEYIACGDIGGPVLDDTLFIGLAEQNDSGYSGIAVLEKNDDKTQVTIYLVRVLDQTGSESTPEA